MKQCNSCKVDKPLNEFSKNKSSKDGLQRTCKICARKQQMKHYHKVGSEKYNKRNKIYRARNKEFVNRYRKIYGECVDCGITDHRVLQFDHLHDKKYNISNMIGSCLGLDLIKEEIRKCEFRCANCHQIKTHH